MPGPISSKKTLFMSGRAIKIIKPGSINKSIDRIHTYTKTNQFTLIDTAKNLSVFKTPELLPHTVYKIYRKLYAD